MRWRRCRRWRGHRWGEGTLWSDRCAWAQGCRGGIARFGGEHAITPGVGTSPAPAGAETFQTDLDSRHLCPCADKAVDSGGWGTHADP